MVVAWTEPRQAGFAEELRLLVHRDAPGIFAVLDAEDDAAFLEPMAFVYAARGTPAPAELAVIYAGAIAPDHRPRELVADADGQGRLFLPGLGYVAGLGARSHVKLVRTASPVGYVVQGSIQQTSPLADWALG